MLVNGAKETLEKSMSLYQYLESKGYVITRIAVERNGEIIPKTTYNECILTEADTLEIVNFVGGG